MDWGDFQTLWEQRFLAVAEGYLDPAPHFVEGSRLAEWKDGSALAVVCEVQLEQPTGSGFWRCNIIVEYDYAPIDDPAEISRVWGSILEAFGHGSDGNDPLRNRLTEGRLVLANGIDAILYDGGMTEDAEAGVKQFQFSAWLGLRAAGATI